MVSKGVALEKAMLQDTNMTTTTETTTTKSTGIEKLHCPQCRRKGLKVTKGTLTVLVPHTKGQTKEVQTDFAHCGECGLISVISARPFTGELFFTESYFPGTECVKMVIPNK